MLNSREMQDGGVPGLGVFKQGTLFLETPKEIYERVFRELKPRTEPPPIEVRYCRFANASSSIRLENGELLVKISDILEGAPPGITESLAHILLGKLYRKPAARVYSHRYRLHMNQKDIRRQTQLIRQLRGRKFISGPEGKHRNLERIFEDLNHRFFNGLMGQPRLGWSVGRSKTALGHFDPSHNAIVITRALDEPAVPLLALEYVMYHEMLHLCFPVEHGGTRRCVHTREFKAAERKFPLIAEAKAALKRL